MGHVHVQDVLRRTFHPQIELARFGPYGSIEKDTQDPRGPRAFIQFRLFLANRGHTLARRGTRSDCAKASGRLGSTKTNEGAQGDPLHTKSWCADLFQVSPNPHVPKPRSLRIECLGLPSQE